MKTSVYSATSLDGFIARPDGRLDWLPGAEAEAEASGEDYGYQAFIDTVDYLVMGRNTYALVLGFEPWPYAGTPVVVLSRRPVEIPARLAGAVEWMSGPPQEVVEQLAERGAQHLYIDGGRTIQGFLAEGLIQQLIITRVPVLIGQGIPLFGPLPHDIKLKHIETQAFPAGLVQSRYEVSSR
jgi:dihydrofolate reductase